MNGQRSKDSFSANRLLDLLVGLLVGGLVGATMMLLLAPRAEKKHASKFRNKAGSCAIRRQKAWKRWRRR